MVSQVQVPHSVVEDKPPIAGELIEGGLAINLKDFRVYSKGYDGVVIRLSGRLEIEDDVATNAEMFIPWVKDSSGNLDAYTSGPKLSFNPSTGRLKATSFEGSGAALSGLTASQITTALGFEPVEALGDQLPPAATDLPSALTLLNAIRAVLVTSGWTG